MRKEEWLRKFRDYEKGAEEVKANYVYIKKVKNAIGPYCYEVGMDTDEFIIREDSFFKYISSDDAIKVLRYIESGISGHNKITKLRNALAKLGNIIYIDKDGRNTTAVYENDIKGSLWDVRRTK